MSEQENPLRADDTRYWAGKASSKPNNTKRDPFTKGSLGAAALGGNRKTHICKVVMIADQ